MKKPSRRSIFVALTILAAAAPLILYRNPLAKDGSELNPSPRVPQVALEDEQAKNPANKQSKVGSPNPSATPTERMVSPATGRYTYVTNGYDKIGRGVFNFETYKYPAVTEREIRASYNYVTILHKFGKDASWTINLGLTPTITSLNHFHLEGGLGKISINPTPYLVAEYLPYTVGKSWNGSWKDKVSGNFTRRVTNHGSAREIGLDANVYVVETGFKFSGETVGVGSMIEWIDPTRALVLFTDFRLEGRSGQFDFETRLQLTLKALNPKPL